VKQKTGARKTRCSLTRPWIMKG